MYWMKKIILVDQDGVLADFRGGFELKWPQYTDEPYTPPTTFYFSRSYPDRLVPLVKKIQRDPGLWVRTSIRVSCLQAKYRRPDSGMSSRVERKVWARMPIV